MSLSSPINSSVNDTSELDCEDESDPYDAFLVAYENNTLVACNATIVSTFEKGSSIRLVTRKCYRSCPANVPRPTSTRGFGWKEVYSGQCSMPLSPSTTQW
jgi:hypothetical protein